MYQKSIFVFEIKHFFKNLQKPGKNSKNFGNLIKLWIKITTKLFAEKISCGAVSA
jgi:hypothetical protein